MNCAIELDKMKKLTRNQKIAIGVGVAAVGGFIIYRIIKKNADGAGEGEAGGSSVSPEQAYKEKVITLQKLVGVTADGVIGPVTKAALTKYGLPTTISASNIDSVINTATNKVASTNVDAARYAKGKAIFDLITKKAGTKLYFPKGGNYSWYKKDAFGDFAKTTVWNLPQYSLYGFIEATKNGVTWSAGKEIVPCYIAITSTGFLYIKPKSYLGDCYDYFGAVSPYDVTVI